MTHTIDQAFAVKCLFVDKLFQIVFNFVSVSPVLHMISHIIHHFHYFDIGAAVFWSF